MKSSCLALLALLGLQTANSAPVTRRPFVCGNKPIRISNDIACTSGSGGLNREDTIGRVRDYVEKLGCLEICSTQRSNLKQKLVSLECSKTRLEFHVNCWCGNGAERQSKEFFYATKIKELDAALEWCAPEPPSASPGKTSLAVPT